MKNALLTLLTALLLVQCQNNSNTAIHPKFVIYTKPGCPRCEKSLGILSQRGISFEERSIAEPQHQREMWELIRSEKDQATTRVTLPVVYMDSVLYYNLQDLEGFFGGI